MLGLITALPSLLVCRFRSRAALELEVVALRHQLAVLRRQRPGRPKVTSLDRLLWVWLYRVWPRCLKVMVLVKSATVVHWHRAGFRLYWRWRSRARRPRADPEVRDLIRQMGRANPLWGAPRIHGELLKLGIEVSQATVAKYMVRRVGRPSPTCAASFHRTWIITTAPGPIFHSIRIVRTRVRSSRRGSAESSPSRKSVVCTIATTASQPDSLQATARCPWSS